MQTPNFLPYKSNLLLFLNTFTSTLQFLKFYQNLSFMLLLNLQKTNFKGSIIHLDNWGIYHADCESGISYIEKIRDMS